jgi:hypothetical protein
LESPALAAIDRFAELPEGWDSYDAPRIADVCRELARQCVSHVQRLLGPPYANPLVGPTAEAGVVLMWRKERGSEIDVLCSPSGARYLVLNPHRQVVLSDAITDFGHFALQVLKRLDL